MSGVDGVVLVDKPAGPTSHDIVQWVRWSLRLRSVGHCGTLDPAATGLLVLCLGGATKLVEYLSGVDKTYQARFVLGVSTDSGDRDGAVISRAEPTEEQLAGVASQLCGMQGTLSLAPPAFSAIRVDGRRAHEMARAGEHVELEPREMRVLAIESDAAPRQRDGSWCLDATLEVSKGTYIRSLAVELGRRVGVPVHLGALHRTRSGAADLADPRAVSGLQAIPHERGWRIRPPNTDDRDGCAEYVREGVLDPVGLLPFGCRSLSPALMARLAQGQRLSPHEPVFEGLLEGDASHLALRAEPPSELLVIARIERLEPGHGRIAPERVLKFPQTAQERPPRGPGTA